MADLTYAGKSRETFAPDLLVIGEVLSEKVTILSGQNLVKGALLGKVTASGKYVLSLSAAGDGSQTPIAIAAEAIDATGGDKEGIVYYRGRFSDKAITFGTGHTIASTKQGLRDANIFLESTL